MNQIKVYADKIDALCSMKERLSVEQWEELVFSCWALMRLYCNVTYSFRLWESNMDACHEAAVVLTKQKGLMFVALAPDTRKLLIETQETLPVKTYQLLDRALRECGQ